MNEKRFIQLINLHIDGEIAPSELEELEQEVSANGRRRAIYQSYCRLQQASQMVCNRFGEALVETVDLKKYQILARNSNRNLRRGLVYSAGALIAACVSVVAAVAVFQDAEWGNSHVGSLSGKGFGDVEVFEPDLLDKRSSSFRTAGLSTPEPFSLLGAMRPSTRSFQPSSTPIVWEDEVRPSSSARAIRGQAAFDAPELVSFQFQR